MDSRVVLAVAGSGKTYSICNSIEKTKQTLIVAYTNENVFNIISELSKNEDIIYENIQVITYHKMLYRYFVRPFETSTVSFFFGQDNFNSKGLTMIPPPRSWVDGSRNHKYIKKDKLGHYLMGERYFASRLVDFVVETKIYEKGIAYLNQHFDKVFIDEFQDFRSKDFDLIKIMLKKLNNLICVGDFYQHSVKRQTTKGSPYLKSNKYIDFDSFEKVLLRGNRKLIIDKESLFKSRRCSKDVTDFITEKLNIPIESSEINDGSIIGVTTVEAAIAILGNDNIIKLIYESSEKYSMNIINWSYSKGNTYEVSCVILNKKYNNLLSSDFELNSMNDNQASVNQLYVALSRSSGDVYIINYDVFKLVECNFRIQ